MLSLAHGYDNLGRRTSLSGAFARFNVPNPANLPVGTDGRTASDTGSAIQYDSNGRLTQDGQFKYIWNELGQLIEMRNLSDNALRGSFSYDAAGRRISKTIDGQTTQYLYDGANPIQLQDGSGTVKENLLAGGIDEWFARTTAGQTQHYLADALGSAIRLTDSSGVKLVDYTYDPYGGTSSDAASTNVFQYAGRENDGLGLYFNRARYYKPKWGRFISQDPIGLAGGDDLYAYVGGNPLEFKDPLGLATCMNGVVGDGNTVGGSWPCPPPPPSGHEACMLACDLVVAAPCKYAAAKTPGPWYAKGGTYLVCNIVVHEICKSTCEPKDPKGGCDNPPSAPFSFGM